MIERKLMSRKSEISLNAATLRNVHLWIPNVFEFKGGIQVYSEFLLESIQNILATSQFEVFLKHDKSVGLGFSIAKNMHLHFSGRWHSPLRTAAFAANLAVFGLKQRPNLVLSTHLNFTPVGYWLKKLTGIPYWTVAHGVDAWDIQRPGLQRALQHADRILAVSHYTRDRLLQEQDLDPDKVLVLPNTFDAERFQIAPKPQHLLDRYQLAADQPVILTVARLDNSERYKGYDQILQAMPAIRQVIPDAHYLLVGKGSDRGRIEHLIHQLKLQDCVTLAGFVPDDELCDYYNLCDVFAMPSKGEGFGIVYLEALACGKPTLGGNQDGAIDALDHGELGVLVDPDRVDDIAQMLIQVLQGKYPHPVLYQPEVLRRRVIAKFGFAQFESTLAEILKTQYFSVDSQR
jgi:glycosyltransferase involved in cell wall biosynthesis